MASHPHDWSILLLGFWNRAILTPAGIAKRLFGLQPGEANLRVEIPVEIPGPFKVSIGRLDVLVDNQYLEIRLHEPNTECLKEGFAIAIAALTRLPETPVSAVGFNLRYKIENPNPDFVRQIQSKIDALNDAELEITSWKIARSLKYGGGFINIQWETTVEEFVEVEINFHRDSENPEKHENLIAWLSMDPEELEKKKDLILHDVIKG